MSRPRTLVLFDVDGTLIDSQSHILGAMEFAFKARGLLLPPASLIKRVLQACANRLPPLRSILGLWSVWRS